MEYYKTIRRLTFSLWRKSKTERVGAGNCMKIEILERKARGGLTKKVIFEKIRRK